MNALLKHVWGESLAVDRVWAQVTGIVPRRAVECPLMVLQTFIDDSYTNGGVFVLAGFIATAETWAKVSQEWDQLLRYGTLAPDGNYHFKMSEMALNAERMVRAEAFYRVIERNLIFPISSKINISELRRASKRIWSLNTPYDP